MKLADSEIHLLSDGSFGLDGGAMFGVVPKVLWERLEPADDKNRIRLGLNSLLLIRGDERILVDTGIGNKYDEKFAAIYAVQRDKTLLDRLAEKQLSPADVTHVIMSHMHFDHIGWNTRYDDSGRLVPTFPNAIYFAQAGEFAVANNPDARSRASYLPENWQPLEQEGRLRLLQGSGEVLPGIESLITGGHTQFHSIIKIRAGDAVVCFLADLVPTPSHLKTPYVMGYDLYPLQTMQMKPQVLRQARDGHWLLIFEHGAGVAAGYLRQAEGPWQLEPLLID